MGKNQLSIKGLVQNYPLIDTKMRIKKGGTHNPKLSQRSGGPPILLSKVPKRLKATRPEKNA